jgi:hypothetical protein
VQKKKRSKKDQTLDTVASLAKAWGEWQLAKSATKAAKKAPWKVIGVATAGAAAVTIGAKKILGGGKSSDSPAPPPPPAYTGPVPDPNAPGASRDDITGSNPSPAEDVHPDPEAPATPDK